MEILVNPYRLILNSQKVILWFGHFLASLADSVQARCAYPQSSICDGLSFAFCFISGRPAPLPDGPRTRRAQKRARAQFNLAQILHAANVCTIDRRVAKLLNFAQNIQVFQLITRFVCQEIKASKNVSLTAGFFTLTHKYNDRGHRKTEKLAYK